MSLQVPTTVEIKDNIVAQLEVAFGQTIPLLPKSFSRVLAAVLASVLVILYKYGGFIFLQMFVQWASTETTTINGNKVIPLVEWGRLVGIGYPTAATRFEGDIEITVTNQTGSLAVNSQLTKVDTGYTYITLAAVPLTAATVTASIRAVSDQDGNGGRGADGNLLVGDIISFVNPLPNVAGDAVVTAITTSAANAEEWDVYRERVIGRFRNQPQGGAYIDYKLWGEEVEGIINVYPYTGDPGQVDVYCEATVASSGDPDGIPTSAQLDDVSDSIEQDAGGLATRRPANAFVNVYAITRTGFDVEIIDLDVAEPDIVKPKISETLTSYFWAKEPYIAGINTGNRNDRITNAGVAGAVQDIVNSYNGVFSSVRITPTAGGSALIVYPLQEGEKAKVVNVTYS